MWLDGGCHKKQVQIFDFSLTKAKRTFPSQRITLRGLTSLYEDIMRLHVQKRKKKLCSVEENKQTNNMNKS